MLTQHPCAARPCAAKPLPAPLSPGSVRCGVAEHAHPDQNRACDENQRTRLLNVAKILCD
eukprot:4488029-Pleurochrysis_carterae.AAC.2